MTTRRSIRLGFLTLALLGGCSKSTLHPPSLAPRAAEAIDPRLGVEHPLVVKPADAALRSRVEALVGEARAGDRAFQAALGPARKAAAAAGAPRSESWISAQELLTALDASRAPTSRAVGEIDALAAERVHDAGGIGASDLAAITAAADEVSAMDRRQAAELKQLNSQLAH